MEKLHKSYKDFTDINFPPLTDAQKKELERLANMDDSEIDYSDCPPCKGDGRPYYFDCLEGESDARLTSDNNVACLQTLT